MKCMGELPTTLENTDPKPIHEHNHSLDDDQINVIKTLSNMKDIAKKGLFRPLYVFAEGLSKLNNNIRTKMPVEDCKNDIKKSKIEIESGRTN